MQQIFLVECSINSHIHGVVAKGAASQVSKEMDWLGLLQITLCISVNTCVSNEALLFAKYLVQFFLCSSLECKFHMPVKLNRSPISCVTQIKNVGIWFDLAELYTQISIYDPRTKRGPRSVATSPAAPGRQISRTDGQDHASSDHFAKIPSNFG